MTPEERRASEQEAKRLLAEIHRLHAQIERKIIENENLKVELETLIKNIEILTENTKTMDAEVNKSMLYVKERFDDADISTHQLFELIDDLTKSYFIFKNMSTASKNVTQFTDEYYTKFKFFNKLRRITLGYVVGLDAHICSDETLRKQVEEVYLQNTEYWLAYAIMAVMLWASDEEEAAKRAVSKAMNFDYNNSSLFFLLVNLRFTRVDAAKKWYLLYLNRVDMENIGDEWQYLLQTYLSGVFGVDKAFHSLVNKYFTNLLVQMETMHPNYGSMVVSKTKSFSEAYIHITQNEFETLRRHSPNYEEMKNLLSCAEKNEVLAIYFRNVFEKDNDIDSDIFQRIENILYDLINAYDKEELKVIKKRRYNEMIIKAKGDIGQAQRFYNLEFPNEVHNQSLDLLLYKWAFEDDSSQVDITVKKFALLYLKKWIAKGFEAFADEYRKKEKKKYVISIDGWRKECDEDSYQKNQEDLMKYYYKNKLRDTIKDKYVRIFIGMAVVSILTLIITAFMFNKITLVIGILLGVVSGFLLWQRITDMQMILKAKQEQGCMILKKSCEEMKAWRDLYKSEDAKNEALVNVFENIEF